MGNKKLTKSRTLLSYNSHQSWDFQSRLIYPRCSLDKIPYTYSKNSLNFYSLKNKLNKTKVKIYIFWVLQLNTYENTQHMRCKRDQQLCKAKLFQFLTYMRWSLCPYSSEALCDYSSTRTMMEAKQHQRDEATCCSGRRKACQVCYSPGKKKCYTEIRKKPQNKVCLEQYKHNNHKRPRQLILTATSHYKHFSNSVSSAVVSGQLRGVFIFFSFCFLLHPGKKYPQKSHNNFFHSSFLKQIFNWQKFLTRCLIS